MNKETLELDVVAKAHKATQKIRQPSWAAHCQALSINMDEEEKKAEGFHTRPTIKVRTPAYDFRPTPLYTVVPPQVRAPIAPTPCKVISQELDLDWET